MDVMKNSDMVTLLHKHGSISEPVTRYFILQVLEALQDLDTIGMYHRDVKPENFLLDDHFNLLLTDFGFATKDKISDEYFGTPLYMSKEVAG